MRRWYLNMLLLSNLKRSWYHKHNSSFRGGAQLVAFALTTRGLTASGIVGLGLVGLGTRKVVCFARH